jgi:hypothetical protein
MKPDSQSISSLATGAAIGIPSLGAVAIWLQSPWLYPSNLLEQGIFSLILVRAVIFFGVPRFRNIQTGTAIVGLTGDVLILPFAAGMYYLTGDASFATIAGDYLGAWLSAALLLYTPVAGLAVAEAMRRRVRLTGVVPGSAGAFILSALVLEGVVNSGGSNGFASIARLTIGNLRGNISPAPSLTPLLLGCGALLFASLAVYSVTIGSARSGNLVPSLAVGLAGVAVVLGWVQVTSGLPSWEAFGLPVVIVTGLLWVITHEW